jgi:hypothetical protein
MAGARYAGRLRQGRIGARTLVVHGSADIVVDSRNAKLLVGCIPGARLVTFPRLGHLLFWEDPVGFAAVVASFLLDADGGTWPPPGDAQSARPQGPVPEILRGEMRVTKPAG